MADHGSDEPPHPSVLAPPPQLDATQEWDGRPRHRRDSTRRRRRRSRADRRGADTGRSRPARTGAQWRRIRRLVAAGLVLVVTAVTLGSALRGTSQPVVSPAPVGPQSPVPLVAAPPPTPLRLATHGVVVLYVPIAESRITAIDYHAVADANVLDLTPSGKLLNAGLLQSLEQQVVGTDSAAPRYYVTDASTASVDVGARAGTQVYSPVDGTVVGISPYVINGAAWGVVLSIAPAADPSVVVRITNLQPVATLQVGDAVTATQTPTLLGTVADLSPVLKMDLARYTSDAGNHVHIEVRPAVVLGIP